MFEGLRAMHRLTAAVLIVVATPLAALVGTVARSSGLLGVLTLNTCNPSAPLAT